jgi:hypothetical protein
LHTHTTLIGYAEGVSNMVKAPRDALHSILLFGDTPKLDQAS